MSTTLTTTFGTARRSSVGTIAPSSNRRVRAAAGDGADGIPVCQGGAPTVVPGAEASVMVVPGIIGWPFFQRDGLPTERMPHAAAAESAILGSRRASVPAGAAALL